MDDLEKINTSQIKIQVYNRCRKKILDGQWKPGVKLPSESQLCDQMGVSRVSVRSALQSLEAQGFIEIRRGEGSYVKKITLSDHLDFLTPILALEKTEILDVLEYRIIIEPNIMPFVIDKATSQDLDDLELIYQQMKDSTDDIHNFASLDEQFHLRLVDIVSNSVIQKVYVVLFELFNSAWIEICEILGVKDGLHYHREIIKSIRDKDVKLATELMAEHVTKTHRKIKEHFNKR